MESNPDLKVDFASDALNGISVALCISGGIAAIEAPKIARQLRRHGARVKAYVTSSVFNFVGKSSLEWGTENEVVSKLSGNAEHICTEDIVLVAPATLNTINKIFTGIADNVVTTLIASSIGQDKKIFLVPTMHESLYENPILKKNLSSAKEYGISIIPPRISEGKAKLPKINDVVQAIIRNLK